MEFKYPIATARISGGVDAGLSMQRSERQARKIAKEAVSRAVSRVDSMNRETRTRRELMRSEQGYSYALDNSGGGNLHGVYRWVDRVDTYQTFMFPDRLLLEFQIPDPAEFYRWRTKRAADTAADKPPEWKLHPKQIRLDKPDELIELARTYRATNVPAPPDKEISVVRTLSVEVGKDWEPSNEKSAVVNPPTATKDVEIPIPPDYEATRICYEGTGYPVQWWWVDPPANQSSPSVLYGYRSAFATVSIGNESKQHWNGGVTIGGAPLSIESVDELQVYPTSSSSQNEIDYGRAILAIGKDFSRDPATAEVALMPPARDLVKIAVTTSGLAQCAVTVLAKCRLTKVAEEAWRLAVYDTLFQAWSSWKRDYDSSLMRTVFGSMAADAGSTQRNEQTLREELKREAISWLLAESPFKGRPGRKQSTTNDFDDVNFNTARHDATTIQFLEQAFEWTNMSYVFYPYYWADRVDWPERTQLLANDPEFERFLRSGSARVILPARPGFEDAVKNWLLTLVPFISGRLPSPDEDLYIRIDTEIRELTSPWEGGYAGDTWQSRVSTTMLYLEEKGDLPFVNSLHQLPAPKDKWYTPGPIIKFP